MRDWWRRAQPSIIANLAYCFARLLDLTWRVKLHGDEHMQPGTKGKVLAGWHGRSLLAITRWKNRGYYVLISNSRDGEIMSRLFRKFGYKVLRGSTGMDKGGARAAAECAKILKSGGIILFAADGAKGPSHIVQRGVVWLAQKGEAEVVPVATSAKPRKLMGSWDKYQIPMPFARGALLAAPPIEVPKTATEEDLDKLRTTIGEAIDAAENEAERDVGWN